VEERELDRFHAAFGRISSDLAGRREFHAIARQDFYFLEALLGDTRRYQPILGLPAKTRKTTQAEGDKTDF
jgi:hypothetical protein